MHGRRSHSRPIALSLCALALIASVTGCGGDKESAPATTSEPLTTETTPPPTTQAPPPQPTVRTITIVVEGGNPVGGIQRPNIEKDERIVLVVRSDVADEVHLHGYDLSREVPAGGTTSIGFLATIPGRFELELEKLGAQIAELTIEP